VLLGQHAGNGSREPILKRLHFADYKLSNLGITNKHLLGIKFKYPDPVGLGAWLPSVGLLDNEEKKGDNIIPDEVSKFLRGSKTLARENEAVLKLRDGNAALVAQGRGFAMLRPYNPDHPLPGIEDPLQFIRQMSIFGLHKAYELAMQQATLNVAEALNKKSQHPKNGHRELMKSQEALAEFDARYYFESPVEPSRHELTKCARMFAAYSTSCCQHNDLVNQIERLGTLARHKLDKKRECRFNCLALLIAIVGILLAAGQLMGHSPQQWQELSSQWWGVVFDRLSQLLSVVFDLIQ